MSKQIFKKEQKIAHLNPTLDAISFSIKSQITCVCIDQKQKVLVWNLKS